MNIIDVYAWLKTSSRKIIDSRISNIYYYKENDIIIIKIKGQLSKEYLVLQSGRRIHLSSRITPPTEFKPYPLVVLARKYMRGDKIHDIGFVGRDRIVYVQGNRGYRLVVELLPRGIIALVDPSNIALALTKEVRVKDRTIKPKSKYVPPPSKPSVLFSLLENGAISKEELRKCIITGKDLVRGLIRGCSIPGEVAEESLFRAGLRKDLSPSNVTDSDLDALSEQLGNIIKEALEGKGWLVKAENILEADPFIPKRYETEDFEVTEYDSFDDALDILFSQPTKKEKKISEGEESGEYARLVKSLKEAEERVEFYLNEAEKLRKIAQLIASNYNVFEQIFSLIKNERPLNKTIGTITIKRLDSKYNITISDNYSFTYYPNESADQVVVRLYREAGELEAKAKRAENMKHEILSKVDELRIKVEAKKILEKTKRRKRYWFEKYHWTITRGGLLAVGGRDASQNESVVKKHLSKEDIFLHANIHGAPAVVLKTRGKLPTKEDLYDAAVITAAYSRAWKAGAGSIEVYWVEAEKVSFSPPSGEYLAKGGIMVYGKKHFLDRPVPVRLAVGIGLNEEEVPIVIAGSEESVSKRSIIYAVIAPGDLTKTEASNTLKKKWAEILPKNEKPLVYGIRDEELMPRLPGKTRILRIKKGKGEAISLSDISSS